MELLLVQNLTSTVDSGMGARSRKGAQLEILLDLHMTVLGPWAEDISAREDL
jgi:hypothetical protein